LVVDYAQLKRERGWLDMGDLEQAALALMSDPVLSGWVQERLDARVRHLMIDEFQDTNPLQWQALHAWLSGYAGAGQAPSVFIVGDPKQSIYRFRRAEPQVFLAAKAFVKHGLNGDWLSCDHTRRNARAIIELVNRVMLEAQSAGQFDGFRSHSTESAKAGAVLKLQQIVRAEKVNTDVHDDPQWRDSLTTPRFEEEESRKALECRQAARWIAQQLQEAQRTGAPLAPGDIMVLARKRERLGLMQAELAALHIPAQQPEKNDLADMPEVQDLIALLDVLVSPRHDLSLARALKSPLFGLSDDALVELALCQRTLQARAREDAKDAAAPKPVVSWLETLQTASGLPQTLVAIGATLAHWKHWVDTLPPHDALSAIYLNGDVVARYAAAVTPQMRSSVVANLNALPNAALAVDGGRYSTAYSLVRALRAGGTKAPVRADAGAVQLLTIHGAKGLEAPVVLLLDTDAELQRAESMGVLVDWPGEASTPTRFVFMASESRPPACAIDALAQEQTARRREELNALYVALTRTKETLVVSSMAPRSANGSSWWQRLQGHATQVELAAPHETTDAATDVGPQSFVLQALPQITQRADRLAVTTSLKSVAESSETLESVDSRIGQAMHRLLEWLPVVTGGYRDKADGLQKHEALWTSQQLARVAQDFALDRDQVARARAMAIGIATGQGVWAWDAEFLRWYSNEVPIQCAGRMLRIDRLVQDRLSGWWVLDYKSSALPQLQADLCDQLRGYRTVIAQVYPGQSVRCAFMTPQGALIEIPAA
jgi:ATP-dependent helicase/nuclease subunit A